jgi:hypothetical protein
MQGAVSLSGGASSTDKGRYSDESIKIKNRDMYWNIAADLHFPPGFDEKKKYPAIISAHPHRQL